MTSKLAPGALRKLDAHQWQRDQHEHYVEPEWVARRLFEVEPFIVNIWDPACGFGRIPDAARAAHHVCIATDIVDRGYAHFHGVEDFLKSDRHVGNVVSNPPFDQFEPFARHALKLAYNKVALICLVRRLNAARWLKQTPLAQIWLLTPRPSMPPGHVIARGEKPGGGTQEFSWLVWDRAHTGPPLLGWLHRDGERASPTMARRLRANGTAARRRRGAP